VRNTAPAGEEHRRPDVRQRDRIPEAASWKITGKYLTKRMEEKSCILPFSPGMIYSFHQIKKGKQNE